VRIKGKFEKNLIMCVFIVACLLCVFVKVMDDSLYSIEVFTQLGLSLNEAKVFFALTRTGTATAKTIAKTSGVAREVVYRVMPKLHKKGLIEEVLSAPKAFKAIAIKDACDLLLHRKDEENEALREKVRKILRKKQATTYHYAENSILVLPSSKNGPRWRHEWRNVQQSVDMIMPYRKFVQWVQSLAEQRIKSVRKRNVKIRIITEQQSQDIIKNLHMASNSLADKLARVKFKFTPTVLSTDMVVFDRKVTFVSVQKEDLIENMRWLCTNNPLIVEIATNYFENMWTKAKDEIKTKTPKTDSTPTATTTTTTSTTTATPKKQQRKKHKLSPVLQT
jgi:sugar-specific transcriptional regulator TrmB